MQFRDWITTKQLVKNTRRLHVSWDELKKAFHLDQLEVRQWSGDVEQRGRARVAMEAQWNDTSSPYYNVWPVVIEPMQKIKLDLLCDYIRPPASPILLRFPAGQEPVTDAGIPIRCLMMTGALSRDHELELAVISQTDSIGDCLYFICFLLTKGKSLEEAIDGLGQEYCVDDDPATRAVNKLAVRFASALCLMKDDPDLIIPDVLDKDRASFSETGDQKYVDKAHRRGKFAWHIGSRLEVDPHYRRAHFGLRWTGEGRKLPRIVPIKGCIVKRHKLTQVPTGYAQEATENLEV